MHEFVGSFVNYTVALVCCSLSKMLEVCVFISFSSIECADDSLAENCYTRGS